MAEIFFLLCSMLSGTYYAHNYASIIGGSLPVATFIKTNKIFHNPEVNVGCFSQSPHATYRRMLCNMYSYVIQLFLLLPGRKFH